MTAIPLHMTEHDFDLLAENAMEWGQHWAAHDGRFEHMEQHYATAPSYKWAIAYWVGRHWTGVILAKSWLEHAGHAYEILSDQAIHPNGDSFGFVILTDYRTASWRSKD